MFILNSVERHSQNIYHIHTLTQNTIQIPHTALQVLFLFLQHKCLTLPLFSLAEFQFKFFKYVKLLCSPGLLHLEYSIGSSFQYRHTPTATIPMVALYALCKISSHHLPSLFIVYDLFPLQHFPLVMIFCLVFSPLKCKPHEDSDYCITIFSTVLGTQLTLNKEFSNQ